MVYTGTATNANTIHLRSRRASRRDGIDEYPFGSTGNKRALHGGSASRTSRGRTRGGGRGEFRKDSHWGDGGMRRGRPKPATFYRRQGVLSQSSVRGENRLALRGVNGIRYRIRGNVVEWAINRTRTAESMLRSKKEFDQGTRTLLLVFSFDGFPWIWWGALPSTSEQLTYRPKTVRKPSENPRKSVEICGFGRFG